MENTQENVDAFLEDVARFLTVSLKDVKLEKGQVQQRSSLMAKLTTLQDHVPHDWVETMSDTEESGGEQEEPGGNPKTAAIPMVPAMDLMPNYCGWLLKKRKAGGLKSKMGGPQRRWCCIKGGVFYYYKDDLSQKQQGSLYLHGYIAEVVPAKKNAMTSLWFRLIKPGFRSYEFQAIDEAVLQQWFDAIVKGAAFLQHSGPPSDETSRSMALRRLPSLPMDIRRPALQQDDADMRPPWVEKRPPLDPLFIPEQDNYDDTDIDPQNDEYYDDVRGPAQRPPPIPLRPAPLADVIGAPLIILQTTPMNKHPVPPAKHLKPTFNKVQTPRKPTPIDQSVDDESDEVYEDVTVPESDTAQDNCDSDSSEYDDAISLIKPPEHVLNKRNQVNHTYNSSLDEGFSSQLSDKSSSNNSMKCASSVGTPLPPVPQLPVEHDDAMPKHQQTNNASHGKVRGDFKNKLEATFAKKPPQWNPKSEFYRKLHFAIRDFQTKRSDELSFKNGDVIKVVDKSFDRQRWWTGSRDGNMGLVPKTYLREAYLPV